MVRRIENTTTVRYARGNETPEGAQDDRRHGAAPFLPRSDDVLHRAQLGRYILLHRLGAGGMGVVYLAHDPQLDRHVAVKVLRDTPTAGDESRLRLLREAQAMAKLSHPNVVNVYDVGLSDLGVHIAMEFIDGKTLGSWVSQDEPSVEAILKVCIGAGRGVAAAHAAGFVHRDLKPGNILVALGPGSKPAKGMVVDFGLARAAYCPGSEQSQPGNVEATTTVDTVSAKTPANILESPLTEEGFVVGTPAYMAPEQRRGAAPSSATDQFSFCVTVFEALFGHRPNQSPTQASLASAHHHELSKSDLRLRARVRPVLERGLHPNPNRRFNSMSDLLRAMDKVVDPQTQRVWYATMGLTATAAAVVGLAVAESDSETSAATGCTNAGERLAGVWDPTQKQAVGAAFAAISKPFAAESWARVRDRLDEYAATWTAAYTSACEASHVLGQQTGPQLDARMRCLEARRVELRATVEALRETDAAAAQRAINQVSGLGQVDRCNDVSALLADIATPSDPRKAFRVQQLRKRLHEAQAWRRAGKFQKAQDLASLVAKEANALDYAPLEADATATLAETQYGLRDVDAAFESWNRAHTLATEAGDDIEAANVATQLVATLAAEYSRFDEATKWARHAQAALDRHSSTDGYLWRHLQGQLHNNIGVMLAYKGEHKEAHEHYHKALAIKRDLLGEPHVEIASILQNIGIGESEFGNTEKAVMLLEQSIEMHRETLGAHHPYVMSPVSALAGIKMLAGELQAAESLYDEVLKIAKGSVGLDSPHAIQTFNSAGYIAAQRGDFERAVQLSTEGLERCRKSFPANSNFVASCHAQLATVYSLQGDNEKAREQSAQSFAIAREALGPDHPDTAIVESGLGVALVRLGRFEEARVHLDSALKTRTTALGRDHFEVANSYSDLADLNSEQDRHDEALRYYKLALEIYVATAGEDHPNTRAALSGIGFALLRTNKPAEAIEPFRRSLAPVDGGGEHFEITVATARFGLAQALIGSGGNRKQALELSAKSLAFFRSGGPGLADKATEVARWQRRQK